MRAICNNANAIAICDNQSFNSLHMYIVREKFSSRYGSVKFLFYEVVYVECLKIKHHSTEFMNFPTCFPRKEYSM